MTDHEHELALDEARTEMAEAIAEYTATATKQLAQMAFHHIQRCWDNDIAYKIWDEAFAEGERMVKKAEDEAP